MNPHDNITEKGITIPMPGERGQILIPIARIVDVKAVHTPWSPMDPQDLTATLFVHTATEIQAIEYSYYPDAELACGLLRGYMVLHAEAAKSGLVEIGRHTLKIPASDRRPSETVIIANLRHVMLMRITRVGKPMEDATRMILVSVVPGSQFDSERESRYVDYPTWAAAEADQARIKAAMEVRKRRGQKEATR